MSKKTKTVDLALTNYELHYLFELLEAELDFYCEWEAEKDTNRKLRTKIKNAQKKYSKIHSELTK